MYLLAMFASLSRMPLVLDPGMEACLHMVRHERHGKGEQDQRVLAQGGSSRTRSSVSRHLVPSRPQLISWGWLLGQ